MFAGPTIRRTRPLRLLLVSSLLRAAVARGHRRRRARRPRIDRKPHFHLSGVVTGIASPPCPNACRSCRRITVPIAMACRRAIMTMTPLLRQRAGGDMNLAERGAASFTGESNCRSSPRAGRRTSRFADSSSMRLSSPRATACPSSWRVCACSSDLRSSSTVGLLSYCLRVIGLCVASRLRLTAIWVNHRTSQGKLAMARTLSLRGQGCRALVCCR